MDHYYHLLNDNAISEFLRFNRGARIETRTVPFSSGSIAVTTVRGTVLEKASTARIRLSTRNPETGEDTRFDVFQIKTYPANPQVPILLFNLENRVAGEDRFGGFLDLAPVAADIRELMLPADGMNELARKHTVDCESLRKRLANLYNGDPRDSALNAGIGIRLDLAREQFPFVREAGLKWIEWYFTLVEERQKTECSVDDHRRMNWVRSRILAFYLLKDISFRIIQQLGVPLDVMALVHFAPTIHY